MVFSSLGLLVFFWPQYWPAKAKNGFPCTVILYAESGHLFSGMPYIPICSFLWVNRPLGPFRDSC